MPPLRVVIDHAGLHLLRRLLAAEDFQQHQAEVNGGAGAAADFLEQVLDRKERKESGRP